MSGFFNVRLPHRDVARDYPVFATAEVSPGLEVALVYDPDAQRTHIVTFSSKEGLPADQQPVQVAGSGMNPPAPVQSDVSGKVDALTRAVQALVDIQTKQATTAATATPPPPPIDTAGIPAGETQVQETPFEPPTPPATS